MERGLIKMDFGKGQQDQRTDRFALFQAMANKMDSITNNLGLMAQQDKDQIAVSEMVVKLQIVDVISICLGVMEIPFFMEKKDFDKLPEDERALILKKNRFYIHESLMKMEISELSYIMSKLMKDANMGFTYQQDSHSDVSQFNKWRKARKG
jgi:hypothetical protein